MAQTCPQCGAEVSSEAPDCLECGAGLPRNVTASTDPLFEAAWEESPGRPRWLAAIGAAAETALRFALRPEPTFRAFRFSGPVSLALAYAVLLGGPSLLLGVVVATAESLTALPPPLRALTALGLLIPAPVLYVYVRAQLLHLTLIFTHRAVQSFPATLRVVAYANASVAPLLVIPFVGDFLFLVCGAFVETVGLRWGHRLTPKQAFLVELIPVSILVLCLASATLIGILWWSQASGLELGMTSPQPPAATTPAPA